jgi:hypothetical protein
VTHADDGNPGTPGRARATLEQIASMADHCEVENERTVIARMKSGTVDTWVRVEKDLYELRSSTVI